jgi:hypothetical protein
MYLEICEPPLLIGASQEIVAVVPEIEVVTFLGAVGSPKTVTEKVVELVSPSASVMLTVMFAVPAMPFGLTPIVAEVNVFPETEMSLFATTD